MYYAVQLLYILSTALVAPVYVVFLLRRGLDYRGVALVDGFYMVTVAALDYPTGGLADRYGRGRVAALGCAFLGLGLLSYSASQTLAQFLASELLAAIGSSLYSGALVAWLVDALREEGRAGGLAEVLGRARFIAMLGSAAGSFAGGLVASLGLNLPFAVGACAGFTAALIAAAGTRGRGEPRGVHRGGSGYFDLLRRGAALLARTRMLVALTACSSLVALAIPSFNLTWAPRLKALGAPTWALGPAGCALMATAALGGLAGGAVSSRLGHQGAALAALALMALSFTAMGLAGDPWLFLAATIPYELGYGMLGPMITAWFNEYVPSGERATVISLRRTIVVPFSAAGMAVMGFLCDLYSPALTYAFGALAIAASALVCLKAGSG